MRIFMWNNSYTTHELSIDAQHKELFTLLRELQLELYAEVQLKDVQDKIQKLHMYCLKHLEEEMQLISPYADSLPMYNDHVMQHKLFVEKIAVFTERIEKEGTEVAKDLCQFISDWLANHIASMDIKTFEAIRALQK